ncbi:hypothetical protein GUITHDRAFT_110402 [Guillardia theta CCMP2712]|uniref:Uncharacterized protein n=2 Tax=Guillardia theta TaxID=55529 RepID=L1J655_GUITC|nr:hypothetical protein GUITHDRAFT_110402 [Guillardia theta CCMP2712]EKX43599.1 hypothetical protein GUITHDRAFT_110402 [Guillardia theta CCMP2712]|mmetsp:Transcript_43498/g.137584  ORF Transcript_43498/g.137584 Transcript_43498/m.137584 type:complete len:890 (+) Transcript_43498:74-2743(+)|eukprot:XP_005830579.1 hypothetical protein GUITHDRAFT_110402 [Guillardia theta CCMP2712]
MTMPLRSSLLVMLASTCCLLYMGYGKVPRIELLSSSAGDAILMKQLEEDDRLLAGLDSRFDAGHQASARRAHYMISKFGKVPASWCAPDSPKCEDMAGKRFLGQGQEALGNGLLNLAAKDPDLYEKAMKRNGGSFDRARRMAQSEGSGEKESKLVKDPPQISGLDRLKDAFPDLYTKAIARNGGRMVKVDHSKAGAENLDKGRRVAPEQKARLSSLAQVQQDPLLGSLENELQQQEALTKEAEEQKKSAQAEMKQVRSNEALMIEQAALSREQQALKDAKTFLAGSKKDRMDSEKKRDTLKKAAEIRRKVEKLKEQRKKDVAESKKIIEARDMAKSSLESSLKSMTIHKAIANLLADSSFDSQALHVAHSLQKMEDEKSELEKEAARNKQLTEKYLHEASRLKTHKEVAPAQLSKHSSNHNTNNAKQNLDSILEQEKLQVKRAASRVRKSHRRMLKAKRFQEQQAKKVMQSEAVKVKAHSLIVRPPFDRAVAAAKTSGGEVRQPAIAHQVKRPTVHHEQKQIAKAQPPHHPTPRANSAADLRSALTGFERQMKSAIASEVDKTVEPLKHEIEQMKTSLEVQRGESEGYKSALSAVLKDTVGAIVKKALPANVQSKAASSSSSSSSSASQPVLSDSPPMPQRQERFARDDLVRYEDAASHDKETSGITYHDHFAHLDPASEENMRTMYGSEWKYTNPDVPYRYGRRQEDASGQLTSVPASAMASGEAPKDFIGTVDESEFSKANRGKLGDHLVGGDDKMVPRLFSNKELQRSTYTGSVEHNVKMEKQDDDHGLIGDRFWALPAGEDNRHLMYGKLEDYSGDKRLGFGDQLVPLHEAIKEQWGAGHWQGMHTQHLADFLVSVNPTGDPKAFGTHPFKVRSVEEGGDGKTQD